MHGMFSMRQLQEHRNDIAQQKEFEQLLGDDSEGTDFKNVDTLDIMTSLRDQFGNIRQRMQDKRVLRSKRGRSTLSNQPRIDTFMNSLAKKVNTYESDDQQLEPREPASDL